MLAIDRPDPARRDCKPPQEYLTGVAVASEQEIDKTQIKSWEKVDLTKCKYRTPARVFEDCGGRSDPSVIHGVMKGYAKCVAMGPPWIQIHPQTGLVEIVIIEYGWQEQFREAWNTYCNVKVNATSVIEDKAVDVNTKENSKKGRAGNAKEKGKGKDNTTPGNGTRKGGAKEEIGQKNDFKSLKKEAAAVRDTFQKTKTNAVELVEMIDKNIEWDWAKGKPRTNLADQVNLIKAAMKPSLQEFLLVQDEKTLKETGFYQRFPEATLLRDFMHLRDSVKPLITRLTKLIGKTNRSHNEMREDVAGAPA